MTRKFTRILCWLVFLGQAASAAAPTAKPQQANSISPGPKDTVYAREFQMRCDWTGSSGTDDTAALQQALDAVAAARQSFQPKGGAYVGVAPALVLPKGVCKLSGTVSYAAGYL